MNRNRIFEKCILIGSLLFFCSQWACTYSTTYVEDELGDSGIGNGSGEDGGNDGSDDMSKRVVASKVTQMTTSTNALGSYFAASNMNSLLTQNSALNESDLEPGEYTLQFGVQAPGDGNGFAAYAIVAWKAAGQQQQRIISIFNGASISGVGNGVDVFLVDQSGDTAPRTNNTYKVITTLAKGTRANTQQPPVLVTSPIYVIPPAGGFPPNIQVPNNAGVISVTVTAANSGALAPTDVIVFESGSISTLGVFYANVAIGWNPLVPGTVLLQIENKNASGVNADVTVIWGIEG